MSNQEKIGETEGAEPGGPPHKQTKGVVIRVHSHFVSQQQLSQLLYKACKSGTYRVEMRHNIYMIYLNRDDVEPVTTALSGNPGPVGQGEHPAVSAAARKK